MQERTDFKDNDFFIPQCTTQVVDRPLGSMLAIQELALLILGHLIE